MNAIVGRTAFLAAAAAAVLALAPVSAKATIYDFTTGSNPGADANHAGTAEFNFSGPNNFTLTLTDTGTITDISSVLDGFKFTESGTVGSITLNSIFAADGSVDCTASTNTVSSCTDSSPGSQPVGDYTVVLSGSTTTMTAGTPAGQLHPHGIVNDTIDSNGELDGLRNAEHNPYIEGPVVFTFTTTGETTIPTISNVVFEFGTQPLDINGSVCTTNCGGTSGGPPPGVPEPSAMFVLASGLLGLGFAVRRRWR